MPGVTQEQIAAARRMSAIEFLQKYRPNSLVKSSARGEYQLAEHDSFKINAKSSLWHWKSRDIGGKSALNYLIYVEGVPFVEAVRLLCEESPGYVPTPHEQVERKRPSFRLPPIAENCDRITRYLLGRGISNAVIQYCIERKILYESAEYHKPTASSISCNWLLWTPARQNLSTLCSRSVVKPLRKPSASRPRTVR